MTKSKFILNIFLILLLEHISKRCWDILASSIYAYNIKSIDFSYDSLSSEITDEDLEIPI